jgi:glucosyl-3-phosphoglycerate synthase
VPGEVNTATTWATRRTYHHSAFPARELAALGPRSVSVCLPARNEAPTIGPILDCLVPLREQGVVEQVVVVDDSTDGTADIARRRGAEVYAQSALMAEFGPVRGKGDAMWRALSVLTGDVVCYLDADSEEFGEHFALGLVGPLLRDPRIQFVKGFYRRPLRTAGSTQPSGGGRVTELLARPLLNRFYPDLAGVLQPLAGEIAARRDLLERLPFACGYSVDVALLLDAWRVAGLDALAQVDLDVRQNQHQPLAELGPMAAAVLAGVVSRLERDGRLEPSVDPGFLAPAPDGTFTERGTPLLERPPMAELALSRPALA